MIHFQLCKHCRHGKKFGQIDTNYFCKIDLKLNIQKTKIMAPGPITSQQVDGKTRETVTDFIFLGLQNHC